MLPAPEKASWWRRSHRFCFPACGFHTSSPGSSRHPGGCRTRHRETGRPAGTRRHRPWQSAGRQAICCGCIPRQGPPADAAMPQQDAAERRCRGAPCRRGTDAIRGAVAAKTECGKRGVGSRRCRSALPSPQDRPQREGDVTTRVPRSQTGAHHDACKTWRHAASRRNFAQAIRPARLTA